MFQSILYHCFCAAVAVYTLILFIKWQRKRLSRPPYPPGPKGLPLIGNLCDMPTSHEWVTYTQWSRQYDSSLIHVKLAGAHLIVVNSVKATFDLFEKRSAIYSDRPRMPMISELIGWDGFPFYGYGQRWRTNRRMFHQFFNANASVHYRPQEAKVTHELLYRLAQTPEDYREHFHLMVGSLMLNVTYGIDVRSANDPYVRLVDASIQVIEDARIPGSFLVDTLPILKYIPEWFPGAGFKTKAKEWRKTNIAAIAAPFQYVKDIMARGVHPHSLASQALGECQGNEDLESVVLSVCGVAYFGASDTIVSAMLSFILAMVLHPDVVQKAREELDVVVGQERLPDFSDKPSLPYICAIVYEVLRWYPTGPLGLPHRLMEDDVYEGMFLPAGSIVLQNMWSVLHDADVYKDPETFNPERFLKVDSPNPDVRSPEVAAFGFGRRMCPGRHLALELLFLNIACILATFDIEKAVDEHGTPIIPKEDLTSRMICDPVPFKCSIKPRSPQASSLIPDCAVHHHPQPPIAL